MKKCIIFLLVLLFCSSFAVHAKTELGVGASVDYWVMPSREPEPFDPSNIYFGPVIRMKQFIFQLDLGFRTETDFYGLWSYLDLEVCLDIFLFRISGGLGINYNYMIQSTNSYFGYNAKANVDVKLSKFSVGAYLMLPFIFEDGGITPFSMKATEDGFVDFVPASLGVSLLFWL